MSGKPNIKPPSTFRSYSIVFDHESPHKRLKEVSAEESKPDKEVKYEPITPSLPHKNIVTPSSQMPTSSSKVDIPSTSIKDPSLLLLNHLIIPQLLRNCNKKMLSCFNNWKNEKLWIGIYIMTMLYCKKK
jgi:hypothetical protein